MWYGSILSPRGLTTVSSLFYFFLDPVVKPRGDKRIEQYNIHNQNSIYYIYESI
ncbi:MAG: palindromic element RPE4 domain-containing protein [Rickettsia sp.]